MNDSAFRLTRAQVREVDRRAVEDYHIPGIILMENAALGVFRLIECTSHFPNRTVDIVCGGGNNGGDGLAVARHLHNHDYHVRILLAVDPTKYTGDALINWRIVDAMKIPIVHRDKVVAHLASEKPDLIVDALFGTGLNQPPRDDAVQIISTINNSPVLVLSIDLPSGLDCDSGKPLGPSCVRASLTITFVAEKAGFANPNSKQYTGPITVTDIGCPKEIITQVLRDLPA